MSAAASRRAGGASPQVRLRRALAEVAQAAIDWLDELEADMADREDDEREVFAEDEL